MDAAAFKETLFKIRPRERSRWMLIPAAGRKAVKCCSRSCHSLAARCIVGLHMANELSDKEITKRCRNNQTHTYARKKKKTKCPD